MSESAEHASDLLERFNVLTEVEAQLIEQRIVSKGKAIDLQ